MANLYESAAVVMNYLEEVVSPVVLKGAMLTEEEAERVNERVGQLDLLLSNFARLNPSQAIRINLQVAEIRWCIGLFKRFQKQKVVGLNELRAEYERSLGEADLGLMSNLSYRETRGLQDVH